MKIASLRPWILLLCLGAVPLTGFAQQRYTISGYVQSAENGEPMISARVFDQRSGLGTLTNNFGFFSLTLDAGPIELVASETGFRQLRRSFELRNDTVLTLELAYYSTDEVEIIAELERTIEEQTEMSTIELSAADIKSIPALFGEVDVIKAVQLLPGVQSGSEGSTGLYVRGGGPDQNLILLDDVPLYYVSHLGGFFSVFNADALSTVKLVKGGFPARYGGRLSSVLDIRMRDGSTDRIHGTGALGLIAGRLTLDGPIGDKTTFLVSGRRTWIDLLTRPISRLASMGQASVGYYFYDLNGKITHRFSDRDRLYLSVYGGDDRLGVRSEFSESYDDGTDFVDYEEDIRFGTAWGNQVAALRWNHIYGPRLFSNLTATYTNYRLSTDFSGQFTERRADTTVVEGGEVRYQSGVRDFGLKFDFDYYPSPSHSIRFGAGATHHRFVPGLLGLSVQNAGAPEIDTTIDAQTAETLELIAYIEDEIRVGQRFSANLGVHAASWRVNDQLYYSVQPRASARYQATDYLALKGSLVQMTQFLHLLVNSGVGLPIDLWVPATEKVPPQNSWQGAFGVVSSLGSTDFEASLEGYYKRMTGLIAYKEGVSFISGFGTEGDWQDQVETGGVGEAYGAEFLLRKNRGKTTGWVGYTLSWNYRQFDNINAGIRYPFRYDRRHDASIVVNHKFNDRVDIGATWVFGTGNAVTLATAGYGTTVSPYQDLGFVPDRFGDFLPFNPNGEGIQLFEDGRNGFRIPPYHRLDLSVNFRKETKWGERVWNISFYNLYSRLNPYAVYVSNGSLTGFDLDRRPRLRKIALFPLIPSVSYGFSF